MSRERILIMGAAGRDFHNFNVKYRGDDRYEVVAFTAAQIPGIENRSYPPELAGRLYPQGIPIFPESDLSRLISDLKVDSVIFAYSDLSNEELLDRMSLVISGGTNFSILGPKETMLKAKVPVIAVTATRTGAGKSTVSRRVTDVLREMGKSFTVVRHPMPYGNLKDQAVQRFASESDLVRNGCTVEEREEYEPHLERGNIVFAGVDYERILEEAAKGVEVIVWDGGNNDFPFVKPDLSLTVADVTRADEPITLHGFINLRMADDIVVNKVDQRNPGIAKQYATRLRQINPRAQIIISRSEPSVPDPGSLKGKTVVIVEDGPSVTHGGLPYGIGYRAAVKFGVSRIVDPRPFAVGTLIDVYRKFPHLGPVLPAVGYTPQQLKDLQETLNKVECDVILLGTPSDLGRFIDLRKSYQRVGYEMVEVGDLNMHDILVNFFSSIE